MPIDIPHRELKTGAERFHRGRIPLAIDLLAFWQWSASDLVSNALRGHLAEYLVALDCCDTATLRLEWDAYDCKTRGGAKVEVKSSAYLQSWPQEEYSEITFGIATKQGWVAETNEWLPEKKRHADAYVFCLLKEKDPQRLDPLDLEQWEFYVLLTRVLDKKVGNQKTIGLEPLMKLGPERVEFGGIGERIDGLLFTS
jgi:hypothetical protein